MFEALISYRYIIDIDNTVKPIYGHQGASVARASQGRRRLWKRRDHARSGEAQDPLSLQGAAFTHHPRALQVGRGRFRMEGLRLGMGVVRDARQARRMGKGKWLGGLYDEPLDGSVAHYLDKSNLECDMVVHRRNGTYGLVEVKLRGETLIEKGAASLKTLEAKLDTTRMPPPAFKLIVTAVGNFAYRRTDGVIVTPITCLAP